MKAVTWLVAAIALAGCATPGDPPPDGARGASSSLSCAEPCERLIEDAMRMREPMVAVDPLDARHLVVASHGFERDALGAQRPWAYAHVSRDGGASWSRTRIPGGMDAGPTHPLAEASAFYDTAALILRDGTVLYYGIVVRESARSPATPATPSGEIDRGVDVFVARSRDGGETFGDVVVPGPGPGVTVFQPIPGSPVPGFANDAATDKPWMTASPDGRRLLLVWSLFNVPRSALLWSTSSDAGATWTQPAILTEDAGAFWGANPVVTAAGWSVAYINATLQRILDDAASGRETYDVTVARSADEGRAWRFSTVATGVGWQAPQLRASPDGATLLVAYAALVDRSETPMLASSADDGASWTEARALDEPLAEGGFTMPTMDVGPDGTAFVSHLRYVDGDRLQLRLAAARADGAIARLTLGDPIVGPSQKAGPLGDYMGLAALPRGAFVAWIAREGDQARLVGAEVAWWEGTT